MALSLEIIFLTVTVPVHNIECEGRTDLRLPVFPSRAGRVILDGIVSPLLWTSEPPYKAFASKSLTHSTLSCMITNGPRLRLSTAQIQDTGKIFDEFTSSCAAAGPQYCGLADANSTGASVAARIQSIIDSDFGTNASESWTASSRGQSLAEYPHVFSENDFTKMPNRSVRIQHTLYPFPMDF